MLYSRPQLRLLLAVAALFLAGLLVREWRAGFPDVATRLEQFDQRRASGSSGDGIEGPPPVAGPLAEVVEPGRAPAPTVAHGTAPPAVAPDPRPLDLNRATGAQLSRLPGVGPGLAQRIIEERERRGRFDSPDALRRILGLGPKKLAMLRELVTVGD
jgi:predicted flap endonuclease-1-like 5' DNA nuclease